MKKFANEVLDFDLTKKGQHEAMAKALTEWGAAGFELVAVVACGEFSLQIKVFFKREEAENEKSEAA